MNNIINKKIIHISIISFVIVILLAVTAILMLKYATEGEKNLPFVITKMYVISTAEGENLNSENLLNLSLLQNNDVFFYIEKNEKYKKEEMIKSIILENFAISKQTNIGTTNIYKPIGINSIYEYKKENIVKNLEYIGTTDIGPQTIPNQGGTIEFSIATTNLGEYIATANERIARDGTILKTANVDENNIKATVSFDIIIELESEKSYKGTAIIELPVGDVMTEGVCSQEVTEEIVFKRI